MSGDDWTPPVDEHFADSIASGLKGVFVDAGQDAIDAFDLPVSFDWIEPKSLEYAATRGAEMIGMRRTTSGKLVPNDDARWVIDDFTRDRAREIVAEALEEGLSPQEFSRRLDEAGLFTESRADMIARTEAAIAMGRGKAGAMRESGIEYVYVYDGDSDEFGCDCPEYHDTLQTVEWFDANPTEHPNCTRDARPATREELVEEGLDEDANAPKDDEAEE